ncbi:hypothetical protein ACFQVC_22685 [Streptomyces monticola]|uniref:Uncharacterized protein n=1 Tax=Streptomyces monticola TaxID=2666263 RepID=A0ABW2JLL5_9ACTN
MKETKHRLSRPGGLGARPALRTVCLTAVAAMGISLLTPLVAVAAPVPEPEPGDEISGEPFTTDKLVDPWVGSKRPKKGEPQTGWPCLTAASGTNKGPLMGCLDAPQGKGLDPKGKGALRLTGAQKAQSGVARSTDARPSKDGLELVMNFAAYGGNRAPGADGIALMLLDADAYKGKGKKRAPAGRLGGGLGYDGLEGGYLAIGLDEFGNFSTGLGLVDGRPGEVRKPQMVSLAGPTKGGNPRFGQTELKDKIPGGTISVTEAKTREEAQRSVRIRVSTKGYVSVDMDMTGRQKNWKQVIAPTEIKSGTKVPVPERVLFGVSAATGDSTNIHEVWGAKLRNLPASIRTDLKAKEPLTAGKPGTLLGTAENNKVAGWTDEPFDAVFDLGDKIDLDTSRPIKPGPGWDKCAKAEGTTVKCTFTPDKKKKFQPGDKTPAVEIPVKPKADATGDAVVTGGLGDKDKDREDPNGGGDINLPIAGGGGADQKGPALTSTITPEKVEKGRPASLQMVTSNAEGAGTETGPIRTKVEIPKDFEVTGAAGIGWECPEYPADADAKKRQELAQAELKKSPFECVYKGMTDEQVDKLDMTEEEKARLKKELQEERLPLAGGKHTTPLAINGIVSKDFKGSKLEGKATTTGSSKKPVENLIAIDAVDPALSDPVLTPEVTQEPATAKAGEAVTHEITYSNGDHSRPTKDGELTFGWNVGPQGPFPTEVQADAKDWQCPSKDALKKLVDEVKSTKKGKSFACKHLKPLPAGGKTSPVKVVSDVDKDSSGTLKSTLLTPDLTNGGKDDKGNKLRPKVRDINTLVAAGNQDPDCGGWAKEGTADRTLGRICPQ